MNVLIVSQYFWPENFRINDLVRGLCQRGHSVTVLTGLPNYPEGRFFRGYGFFGKKREDYHGAQVVRVPMLPRGKGSGARLLLNYLSFAFFASLLAPFRCREEYDVIFVYEPSPITVGLPALLLRKLKKAPVAFWVQDLWPESLSATGAVRARWLLNLVERLVKFIYRGCDLVMVQSEAFAPSLEKLGVNRERIAYFPNSAEDLYAPVALPQDAPERAGLPDGFRVMFAGNIGAAQDFGTILGAAEQLKSYPDIHWLILGDGRMLPWVKAQIEERGLGSSVHLLGRHDVEAMPRYFALADAMLVTLKKEPIFALTIPSKVQSYLACGRPVIAALDGEGARVILEASAGVVAPAEDAAGLAEAVLGMYRMEAGAREQMGLNGLRYFWDNFERAMLLERLERWLHEMKEKGCR
ncbi:MAG TPA: glycosyltransferase WbuB [Gallionellaceae bacterium]|nr:glycosyltransferase WbuB [Gallionellaceae bacterium]